MSRDVRITCAAPGCAEFATIDRRHRDNLQGHWRCADHDREAQRLYVMQALSETPDHEVPC